MYYFCLAWHAGKFMIHPTVHIMYFSSKIWKNCKTELFVFSLPAQIGTRGKIYEKLHKYAQNYNQDYARKGMIKKWFDYLHRSSIGGWLLLIYGRVIKFGVQANKASPKQPAPPSLFHLTSSDHNIELFDLSINQKYSASYSDHFFG